VAAALRLNARRFIIDGEAVVLGPDGLSRFDELRRRDGARAAILDAFDLLERDGEDLRPLAFLERKQALAELVSGTSAGILLNEHIAAEGALVFEHPASSARRALSRSASTRPIDRGRTRHGSRFAIPRTSPYSVSAARIGRSKAPRGR
jgi:bifunctional non-homologous end joining protein LigD